MLVLNILHAVPLQQCSDNYKLVERDFYAVIAGVSRPVILPGRMPSLDLQSRERVAYYIPMTSQLSVIINSASVHDLPLLNPYCSKYIYKRFFSINIVVSFSVILSKFIVYNSWGLTSHFSQIIHLVSSPFLLYSYFFHAVWFSCILVY